ncbi:uncharacterized protein METZ01_LOCUS470253, partial [marine metagenome]
MKKFLNGFYLYIRRRYILGLVLLFPLAVTYFIAAFAFNSIDGILQPLFRQIFGRSITGLSFITIFILIFFVGILSSSSVVRAFIKYIEQFVERLPLVNAIYRTSKQVSTAFTGTKKGGGFSRVVAIEYPKESVWTIGFLTNIIDFDGVEHGYVYMPSTPVPNTGWLSVVPMTKIKSLDLTAEQAMRII